MPPSSDVICPAPSTQRPVLVNSKKKKGEKTEENATQNYNMPSSSCLPSSRSNSSSSLSRSMRSISTFSQAPLEMELRYVRPYDGLKSPPLLPLPRRRGSPRQEESARKTVSVEDPSSIRGWWWRGCGVQWGMEYSQVSRTSGTTNMGIRIQIMAA